MKGDDRSPSNAVHARVRPRTRRQIGYDSNIQMVTEGDVGNFSYQDRVIGYGENHLVNKLRAGQPIQVSYPPHDLGGKGHVIVQEADHGGWVKRVFPQRPRDGPAGMACANNENVARFGFTEVLVPSRPSQLAPEHPANQASPDGSERS